MITFNNTTKIYPDGTTAVNQLNLTVEKGEFMTLIGPSGCGKTTALKMINRLIDPSEGAIYIDGKPVNDYSIDVLRWNIGYVLQQIALFPHMTVQENIQIVPELLKWKKEEVAKRTDELLAMTGLDPSVFKKRYPRELSGGQQQRIGVVRALAADPDIILMDEPFSALDPISREQLQTDIDTLQKEIKKTIVFVTHDMDEALKMSDRICLMREGKVIQCDTPEQLMKHPQNNFVEEFIGNRQSLWLKSVRDVMKKDVHAVYAQKVENKVTIPASSTIEDAYAMMHPASQTAFPVMDDDQNIIGSLTRDELLQYFYQQEKEGASIL